MDVYCTKNKVYYEAQVKKLKPAGEKTIAKALFHFIGWSSWFDEWIALDSPRIQEHNVHTNPNTHDPREHEIWQGLFGITSQLRNASRSTPTKRTKKQGKEPEAEQPAATSSGSKRNRTTAVVREEQLPSKKNRRTTKMPCLSPMTATTDESQQSAEASNGFGSN